MAGFLDILSGALNAVDLPRSSVVDLLMGENPIDQWADPFGTTGRRSGRDLLTKWGLTQANKETGMSGWLSDPMEGVADVAGFAVDAFIDPLNAIPVGRLFSALKGRRVASARNRRIDALRGHPERQRVVSEMSDALREQLGPVAAAQQSQDLADLADAAILHKQLDPDRVYGRLRVQGPTAPFEAAGDVSLNYPWQGYKDQTQLNPLGERKEDLLYPDIGTFVDQAYREGYSAAEITKTLRQGDSAGFLRSKLDKSTEARKLVHDALTLMPNINRKRSVQAISDRIVSSILWRGRQNELMREDILAPASKRSSMWDQLFTPEELQQLAQPARFDDQLRDKNKFIEDRKALYDYDFDSDTWRRKPDAPSAADDSTTASTVVPDDTLSVTPENPIDAVLPDSTPSQQKPARRPRRVKEPEDPLDAAIRSVNAALKGKATRSASRMAEAVDDALSGVSPAEARRLLNPAPNPSVQDLSVAYQPDDSLLSPVVRRTSKKDPELMRLEAELRPRQEAMQAERRAAQEAKRQAAATRRLENKIDAERGSAARTVAAELRREQANFDSDAALAAQVNAATQRQRVNDAVESLVGGLTPGESRELANSRLRVNADYNQVDPEITVHPRSVSMTGDRRRLQNPMRGYAAKIDGEWAVPYLTDQSDYWPVYSTPEQARDVAVEIVEGMRQSQNTRLGGSVAEYQPSLLERPIAPESMAAPLEPLASLFPQESFRAFPNAYGRLDLSLPSLSQGLAGRMVFGADANPATAPHELVHWLRGDVFASDLGNGLLRQQIGVEEQFADAIETALLQGGMTNSPALQGPLSRLQRNMEAAYQSGGAMMPQRLMQASPRARQAFGELFGVTRSRSPLDRSELPSLMSPIGQYLLQQAASRFNQYGGVQ